MRTADYNGIISQTRKSNPFQDYDTFEEVTKIKPPGENVLVFIQRHCDKHKRIQEYAVTHGSLKWMNLIAMSCGKSMNAMERDGQVTMKLGHT